MSTYTTTLGLAMQAEFGLEENLGYSQIDAFLTAKANQFFPNYPIFDEAYRIYLNKLIAKTYFTREIAFETVGRWKLAFEAEMLKIMPYYNDLYLANEDIKKYLAENGLRDHFKEREYTRHGNSVDDFVGSSKDTRVGSNEKSADNNQSRTNIGSRETDRNDTTHTANHTNNVGSNVDSSSTDRVEHQLYSDTPQGGVEGIEGHGQGTAVDDLYYLTNVTKNFGNESSKGKSQSEQSSNGTTDFSDAENSKEKSKNQEEVVNHANDYSSSNEENNSKRKEQRENTSAETYVELLKGYKDFPAKNWDALANDLRNVDEMIIRRLDSLFMQVWPDSTNLGNGWFGVFPEKYYY